MGGNGPPPKDPSERVRRNAVPGSVVLAPDDKVRGPDLPELADDETWPAVTVAWWETWRRSAQAQTFVDTDWQFLLETAVLHAEFWRGRRDHAPELRLRVAKFGATTEDRARLRMQIGDPGAQPKARLQPKAKARRERLLRVVGAEG